jgi:hypothetical protein
LILIEALTVIEALIVIEAFTVTEALTEHSPARVVALDV